MHYEDFLVYTEDTSDFCAVFACFIIRQHIVQNSTQLSLAEEKQMKCAFMAPHSRPNQVKSPNTYSQADVKAFMKSNLY